PEGRRIFPYIPDFEILIKIPFQLFLTHQTIKPQNYEKQTLDNLEIRAVGLRIKRHVVVFFLHQGEGPFSNLELHPWILGGE
ncbi:MAG: hypothetical protein ACKOX5_05715, partial [Bacteroidota bacterium]